MDFLEKRPWIYISLRIKIQYIYKLWMIFCSFVARSAQKNVNNLFEHEMEVWYVSVWSKHLILAIRLASYQSIISSLRFFGALWVQKLSAACVKRYGITHRTRKGEKSCIKQQFWTISVLKFSWWCLWMWFKLLIYTPRLHVECPMTLRFHDVELSGRIRIWVTPHRSLPCHRIFHGENFLNKERIAPNKLIWIKLQEKKTSL